MTVAERPRTTLTLSAAQLAVYTSNARFRVLMAGRRFGKSYLACVELLTAAAAAPHSRAWYVAPTYGMAKRITWVPLKRLVPRQYLATKPNETELSLTLINGSEIALHGADAPDRLRGTGLDLVVTDEFAMQDPSVWGEVLRPALADKQGRALFVGTPAGYNWAYDLYLRGQEQRDGWASWQFTTLDGGRVPAEEIAAARAELDPRVFRQEFCASFETMQGRVYANFLRTLREGNVDDRLTDTGGDILVGMDFNVHPMTCVIGVRAGDECHILDALEVPTSNTEEVAAEIRRRYPDRRIIVCPDPSGKARKTSAPVGQTDFTILERFGFQVRASEAAPPVVDRINAVQSMLLSADGRRRLRIHPRATHLIRALDGLTYKEGTSVPDKSSPLGHVVDALGYLVWQEFNLLLNRSWTVGRFRA